MLREILLHMPPEYVTVYQISKQSTDWGFALAGGIPLLVGIILIFAKRKFKWEQPHWAMPIFACGFGILWLCVAGVSVVHESSNALTVYTRGEYQVVEGVVTNFHPMPYEGYQDECFSVQDKRFCYSDYMVTPGFHNATSHGGPIRSGLPVRIAYIGNMIVRLDIPKDQVLTPALSAAARQQGEKQWQARTENDPIEQRMSTAFAFVAVCLTLWWNIQWRRVMQFWLRPPNRIAVQYAFRIFFAISLINAVRGLVQQLRAHPLTRATTIPTLEVTAAMGAAVFVVFGFGLWSIERARRKREQKLAATR